MEEEFDPQQFGVTPGLFREWCAPRFGNANPQKIKSKVWEWLVRSKLSAYASRQKINDPSLLVGGPTWSFDRFGQSVTKLPDGRTIYIAGEHEDFYDSDFYIYNDIVVAHPDGTIDFYCYRKSDFPPTDFHTATVVDEIIVIIGSLGYLGERNWNETPVYLLRLDNFEIHKAESSGTFPGWIHGHIATLSEDKLSIVVTKGKVQTDNGYSLRENIDDWQLHLDDWRWERLTSRNWTQFEIRRKDKKSNHLWDIRHAFWSLENNMKDFYQADMERLERFIGYRPDVKRVRDLYNFDMDHGDLHQNEEDYKQFWIYVDDIRIRFTEEMHSLQVMIEGGLAPNKVRLIEQQLVDKLSVLVNSPCELEEY
jgi:hypothetical protein